MLTWREACSIKGNSDVTQWYAEAQAKLLMEIITAMCATKKGDSKDRLHFKNKGHSKERNNATKNKINITETIMIVLYIILYDWD